MKSKIIAAICIALLSACSPKSPSESDFRLAVNEYLATSHAACFGLGKQLPETLNAMELAYGAGRQLQALEAIGLLRSKADGSKKTFAVADEAKSWFADREQKSVGLAVTRGREGRLCLGTMEVERFEGIKKSAADDEYLINFTYRLADRPDWATQPAVIEAVPKLAALVNGERLHTVRTLRLQLIDGSLKATDPYPR